MPPVELSLVVPTYNERENIVPLLEAVERALAGVEHEVLVADDDSPDRTWEAAEAFARGGAPVRVLRRTGERGLSPAVVEGFEAARGRFLGVMDADLSHDPALLPRLLAAAREGAELAVGSRRLPGGGADRWPLHRRAASDLATALARWATGTTLSDPMSGFFVLRRELYERAKGGIDPRGYKILLELAARGRPRGVRELPFVFRDRRQGYSKLTLKVAAQYLRMLWGLRAAGGTDEPTEA